MTAETDRPKARLVVGCGYLGRRVAVGFRNRGDRVIGTTRSHALELAAIDVEPLVVDVTSPDAFAGLPEVDTVFWAVGFDRSGTGPRAVHVEGLARLLDRIRGTPRVILSSSTGVWGETDGTVVDEATPPHPTREAGRVLLEAESLLRHHRLGPGVALRFAGLYGPGRLPRLDDLRSGRPIAADPDSWLNLVHVDDAARVVVAAALATGPMPLYVVSDGRPVRRREWYGRLAQATGSPEPRWDPTAPRARGGDKRVDSRKAWADLGIAPAHPDAIAAIDSLAATA